MCDKKQRYVRKLRSDVHGVVFDNKAFTILCTTRWNVHVCDKIGHSVTSNLENYDVI